MNYEQAERTAALLADALDEMAGVVREQLGLKTEADRLSRRADQVRADRFKVVVVGEFKRGKSTLLNALLGADVLPQKVTPCTAVVTVIQYGEEPSVRIVFTDDRPDELLSPVEFRARYELEVEDTETPQSANWDRFSVVDRAEVRYPIDLCRHRVELVDSPGLGEHQVRNERVQRFLDRADAIVMVLDATQPLTMEEAHFLDHVLMPRGLKNIFFVINKWNLIEASVLRPEDLDKEVAKIEERFGRKLRPFCVIGGQDRCADRIFRVNALGALKARLRKPPSADMLEESQVPAFEAALQRFLVEDRGQARTSVALAAMRGTRDEVQRYIGAQLSLAGRSLSEMESERAALQPKLERLRGIKRHIESFLSGQSANLQDRLVVSFLDHIVKIKKDLPTAVDGFGLGELTHGSLVWKAVTDWFRDSDHKFAKRIERHLGPQVTRYFEQRLAEWQSAVVRNEMQAVMIDVEKHLQEEAAEYQRVMGEIENKLGIASGGAQSKELVDRWVGAGASSSVGDQFTFSYLAPGLLWDMTWLTAGIITDVSLHLTGLWLPVIGTVITGFRLYLRERSMRDDMKTKLVQGLTTKLDEVAQAQAARIREQVRGGFDALQQRICGSIGEEIALVDASLQGIIEKKRQAEYSVEQEKARLETARAALKATITRTEAALTTDGPSS